MQNMCFEKNLTFSQALVLALFLGTGQVLLLFTSSSAPSLQYSIQGFTPPPENVTQLPEHHLYEYEHDGKQLPEHHLYEYEHNGVPRGASSSMDPAGLSAMSQFTQNFIYLWQHPADCSGKEVILTRPWPAGLGSEMHVTGAQLAWAISNNKVLNWNPESCSQFTGNTVCEGGLRGCECFFQPLTNCSHGSSQVLPEKHGTAPAVLVDMLKQAVPAMDEEMIKYWWRGQSAAYLMRLNKMTHEKIVEMRMNSTIQKAWGRMNTVPFPLPHGAISMHIRHGDKWKEMSLVETGKYLDAAADMAKLGPNQYHSRSVVVTCDDERDIDLAKDFLQKLGSGWTMFYSAIARQDSGFKYDTLESRADRWSWIASHISQIFLALEADAFIGTRASNWNRLIDELRCIWVDKCSHVYVEVGTIQGYEW